MKRFAATVVLAAAAAIAVAVARLPEQWDQDPHFRR